MIWNIITDSSCDIKSLKDITDNEDIRYKSIPFIITVDEKDYIDDDNLDTERLVEAMEESSAASRSCCPAPQEWADAFEKEGCSVAITISKALSGSYNSACAAKHMVLEKYPDKKIAIINSYSAGPGLIILARKLCRYIEEGFDFDTAAAKLEEDARESRIVFALCSYDNLIKNGRISPFAGFVAKKLGFWGVGIANDKGEIAVKSKVRGAKKAINEIIKDMEERRVPTERVVISHCMNEETALLIKQAVSARWSDIPVDINTCRGLCSYYAEKNGLIVSYY
jgi:DegV family protein with EDD domain